MSDTDFMLALQRRGVPVPAGARPTPPRVLLHFGDAPGDDLLCTAVAHELCRRGEGPVWMMTAFPELFAANPDVDVMVSRDLRLVAAVQEVGGRVIVPVYTRHDWDHDRGDRPIPAEHILTVMCRIAGITGSVRLRPHLTLRPDEMGFGRFADRQVAIHTSGNGAVFPMANKNWPAERFQSLVDELRGECDFVQLGTLHDPPLQGVIDLRGRTTLRQAAAVLRQSRLFVGLVGLLMHLARAVDRRAVIVYGGRERPWQSGYTCNENLVRRPPCSPCWQWNRCEFGRVCLTEISTAEVVAAVRRQLSGVEEPIVDDVAEIGQLK